jgi:hypothetical protein
MAGAHGLVPTVCRGDAFIAVDDQRSLCATAQGTVRKAAAK